MQVKIKLKMRKLECTCDMSMQIRLGHRRAASVAWPGNSGPGSTCLQQEQERRNDVREARGAQQSVCGVYLTLTRALRAEY